MYTMINPKQTKLSKNKSEEEEEEEEPEEELEGK